MISTAEMKKGQTIELEGKIYQVLEYEHQKIGRGSALVRVKLRDVRAGHTIERTFQAGAKVPAARIESREYQYLYNEGDLYQFMDQETFEQTMLGPETLGDATKYLKDNAIVTIALYEGEPIGIELPITVELAVAETGPGFKGDTANAGTKPATLETGLIVQVPMFLSTGDVVRVDTRTGAYLERAG